LALSEVLGISLSEVMERYFGKVASSDEEVDRNVEDVDRMVVQAEGEAWVEEEQRRLSEEMDRTHRGEGVDDEF
jgi:hypothetical protein